MIRQIIFGLVLLVTLSIFAYSMARLRALFRLTKPFPISDFGRRIMVTLQVAIGQSRILRFRFTGIMHALVFWGFIVITLGSIEMVADGLAGTDRMMASTGWFYDFVTASGDIMAYVVLLAIIVFLGRRLLIHVKRFAGIEMQPKSKWDALAALAIIFMLMVSLIGINLSTLALHTSDLRGVFPLSKLLLPVLNPPITGSGIMMLHETAWWTHILLIFLFANILPYSKHFHVFTSIPNVFLSRLEPLGYLSNMENVTSEVKMMLYPESIPVEITPAPVSRFGVKDVEDVTWKTYLDSLACTECGRCTSVCPANITGKKLSPRKLFIDLRARMKEKGPSLIKNGAGFDDGKSLLGDYISAEELWACTTCNACARECPVNINQPSLILDMRRFLVMEQAAAPAGLNAMFANIENNGAPWQYSPEDRLKWADDLFLNID
ncbi:MAG TPA: 4Fe-4S dicluster domain-containing protein [Bacteroidales bacterium]